MFILNVSRRYYVLYRISFDCMHDRQLTFFMPESEQEQLEQHSYMYYFIVYHQYEIIFTQLRERLKYILLIVITISECSTVQFEWDFRSFSGLHHLRVSNHLKEHIILYYI